MPSSCRSIKLSVSLGPPAEQSPCLADATRQWCNRNLSNLDYLLLLNRVAGRRLGNPAFHPIVPWVLDMTAAPEDGLAVSLASPFRA